MNTEDPTEPDDSTSDIPDPRPIEIDNLEDTRSPHQSLNGTTLDGRDRIALARLEGDLLAGGRVPAHISLQLAEVLVRSLDSLAGERDATQLEAVDLDAGVQLLLADDADDQTSLTADSPAARAVERLIALIQASSLDALQAILRALDDDQLMLLERLMGLMVGAEVDLNLQRQPSERPTRLTSGRAGSYLAVLQRERADADRPVMFVGKLDGVIAPEGKPKREFRLTLNTPWERRRVIRGSFDDDLTEHMRLLLLQDVKLRAEVSRHTHGERKSTPTFHAVAVRAVDDSLLFDDPPPPGQRGDNS